jgi:hypothetical protein
MVQPISERNYLVEVNVGAAVAVQKQINFSFIPQLEGAVIYAIQSFSRTELSLSPNGSAVATTAGLADLTVTFAVGDNQDFFLVPVADLNSANISGFIRMINDKRLNLTKSFITIQSTTTIAANESVLFLFTYRGQ